MVMPGRKFSSTTNYRYGFNGKEEDDEVKGDGNQQDYGMRIYDPRLGRFLSVDPLYKSFPFYTPYQFAGNMPIAAIDLDGEEPKLVTLINPSTQHKTHILTIDVKVIGIENFSNKANYLEAVGWANKILSRCFSKNNDVNNTFIASINFVEANKVDKESDFYLEFRKDGNFFTSLGNSNAFGEANAIGGNAAIVGSDLALEEVDRFKKVKATGVLNVKDFYRTSIGPEGNYLFGNQRFDIGATFDDLKFWGHTTTYDYSLFYIGSVVAHELGHLLGLDPNTIHTSSYPTDDEKSRFGSTATPLMQARPLFEGINIIGRQKGNFSLTLEQVKFILNGVKDKTEKIKENTSQNDPELYHE